MYSICRRISRIRSSHDSYLIISYSRTRHSGCKCSRCIRSCLSTLIWGSCSRNSCSFFLGVVVVVISCVMVVMLMVVCWW